jgi:hypothetical protein
MRHCRRRNQDARARADRGGPASDRAEAWKQQWLQKGKQKDRQEGRQEGEAALLLRHLERRFGVLPGWARERNFLLTDWPTLAASC